MTNVARVEQRIVYILDRRDSPGFLRCARRDDGHEKGPVERPDRIRISNLE